MIKNTLHCVAGCCCVLRYLVVGVIKKTLQITQLDITNKGKRLRAPPRTIVALPHRKHRHLPVASSHVMSCLSCVMSHHGPRKSWIKSLRPPQNFGPNHGSPSFGVVLWD